MKAKGKQSFGWKEWSTKGLYAVYNIYSDFKVSPRKVVPTGQVYNLNQKSLGKRSALNAHAAFEEAGGGNMICKIIAPLLDPACETLGLKRPCLLDNEAYLMFDASWADPVNPSSGAGGVDNV